MIKPHMKDTKKIGINNTAPEEMLTITAPSGNCVIRMEGDSVRLKKSGTDFLNYDGSQFRIDVGGSFHSTFSTCRPKNSSREKYYLAQIDCLVRNLKKVWCLKIRRHELGSIGF